MYTSATRKKTALIYLAASMCVAIFGGIYECFSHGVYSGFMIFAFAIPLIGGALPSYLTSKKERDYRLCFTQSVLWACGIVTLTIGSIMKGVLDIYGTSNSLILAYPVVGLIVLTAAVITGTHAKTAGSSARH